MPRKNNYGRPTAIQSGRKRTQRAPAKDNSTPVLDENKLNNLYAALLKTHLLAKHLNKLMRRRKISRSALAPGFSEAAVAAAVLHLLPQDLIAPSQSLLLASYVRGAPLHTVLSHLAWLAGSSRAPGKNQLQAAVGMALALNLHHKEAIVLALLDDAKPADWRGPFRLAAKHRLPIVFVLCRAAHRPSLRDQSPTPALPVIAVDAQDAVAVFRVAQESARRARQGLGPALIECRTGSAGASSPHGDALGFMEAYLTSRGISIASLKRRVLEIFSREIKSSGNTQ